jgi:hypothetical protein
MPRQHQTANTLPLLFPSGKGHGSREVRQRIGEAEVHGHCGMMRFMN